MRGVRGLAAVIAACALAVACGGRPVRTADAPPTAGSGGVPVDPVSSLPKLADKSAAAEGVTTLRTPIPTDAVMALVRRLFEAFHEREPALIEPDLDDVIVDLRSESEPTRPRYTIVNEWRARMKSTQAYEQLDVEAMYRSQDVEIWARDELGLPGRPSRPSSMGEGDLLVRIPVATPRLAADVLFGEEIKLLLRRDGARYRVRGYGEVLPK
ncbi:MAG: hypothetical protein HYV09_10460 [Deltaproteobacteria bacterium]|nr:hypothetical protein [Deltaproteobacteria bacterium]